MSQTQNRLELYDFLIIFIAGSFLAGLVQAVMMGAGLMPDQGSSSALFISIWLQEAIILILVAGFLKRRHATAHTIGLRLPTQHRVYTQAVLLGVGVYILMIYMVALINALWPGGLKEQNVQVYMHANDSVAHILFVILTMCVLAPITEEILYRGYLFTSLLRLFSPNLAMFITSFFFAFSHFDIQRFIPLFIGGFILNYFARKTQSVMASAIVHGVWNFGSVASFYIFS